MKNILFVCTGNTCRSPMAEALVKHKTNKIKARSAGIFAGHGQPASRGTTEALREKGILLRHQSQPVTQDLINWADLILTMTTNHKQSLVMQFPQVDDKVYTLKEYVDAEHQRVWTDLKKAYATLEEKRANLQSQSEAAGRLEMEKQIKEDLRKIDELESKLNHVDIHDPFGGDVEIYRKTLKELEKHIELLIEKLDNKDR
ncbi:protein-tyrosine phosphatase [Salirhabdus euzebyi]|uniref:Protein-tyrosine phosphatase n=1 Tax=Salirhabdus euzebyi TaxID=394506 RepID=A0A841Q621_9BACI|nr:low molecular weight protein arginine phosphatase [Salirhabdus euzebyi]MBB6453939.1 protein-tyrosine phosphatase [Salirhabdus euzebyi]